MLTSGLNRVTGMGLSVGLVLLVCWLVAVAGGAQSYARAERVLSHPLMKLVYVGFIVAACYHLVAGIRHLVWDTGRGLERAQSERSAWLVAIISVVLMLLVGYGAWLVMARTP
jgi:succinate dehydrogenase / fumarate reductase, cytochrome b subunit